MKTVYLSSETKLSPCVATIGFFDGVHRGHRYLISRVIEEARRQGLESTVVTFDKHPRQVLNADFQPKLLSTLDEKIALLSKLGIDNCVVLPFTREMASLSARDFMGEILSRRINARKLITGYDNRFGHNRTEGFDDYVAYGKQMDMDVVQGKPFVINGVNVSSTVIRSFLSEGEVEMAQLCLGYPYTLCGRVVHGSHIGTSIGYPTANIEVGSPDKLVPAHGVYAVKVMIESSPDPKQAMMNIGTRPTFGGETTTLETHIFNETCDLYGQRIAVAFVGRLREERKFESISELRKQLKVDAEQACEIFSKDSVAFAT